MGGDNIFVRLVNRDDYIDINRATPVEHVSRESINKSTQRRIRAKNRHFDIKINFEVIFTSEKR